MKQSQSFLLRGRGKTLVPGYETDVILSIAKNPILEGAAWTKAGFK